MSTLEQAQQEGFLVWRPGARTGGASLVPKWRSWCARTLRPCIEVLEQRYGGHVVRVDLTPVGAPWSEALRRQTEELLEQFWEESGVKARPTWEPWSLVVEPLAGDTARSLAQALSTLTRTRRPPLPISGPGEDEVATIEAEALDD